jgi:hypothetical protein
MKKRPSCLNYSFVGTIIPKLLQDPNGAAMQSVTGTRHIFLAPALRVFVLVHFVLLSILDHVTFIPQRKRMNVSCAIRLGSATF